MATGVIDRPVTIAYTQKVTRRHVKKTCDQILLGARRLAPRGSHLSGSGELSPDIPLRVSLKSKIDVTIDNVNGQVGSPVNWAATVHQGSKAHHIVSKRGKILKFRWERGALMMSARGRRRKGGSRMVGRQFWFFGRVHHPGNKRPVRYLTTPMHQFGRANGFRTTSLPVTRSRLP
jgi:hypothetical protein